MTAVVVLIIFFVVWQKFSKSKSETADANKEKDIMREVNNEIKQSNVTLTQVQLNTLSDKIYKAVKGAGTDEKSIYDAIRTLNTKDDVLALIKTFGVRDSMTLREWLYDDLNNKEIQRVNEILVSKGISFAF